ncbi:MAG: PAS domain S-box protein [Syntrophales bacterium]
MKDQSKKKQVLIQELVSLRERIVELEQSESERKKTEDALRETEERYRALASSADSMYLVDRECRYQFMNDAHLLRLGVSLDQVKGRFYGDFHSEEDLEQFAATIEAVFETGKSFQTEHKGRIDGSFFLRTFSPVRSPQGDITAVTVISKDITERRLAEEALRKSEEKYRNILENIAEGYYELDLAGNVTFFNEACRRIYGYSRDELMGMNALKLADEDNAKKAYKYFNEVYTTGKPLTWIDGEIIRKDGAKRNAEASASLIRDLTGQPIGFRGIIRDVTEYRQAEERYKTMAENSLAAVLIIQDGKFRFINTSAIASMGYTSEELIGKDSYSVIHPEDRELVRKKAREMLAGRSNQAFEFRVVTKQNEVRWISQTVTPIHYQGRPAILGNAMDITEQKRADEALRERELFFSGTLNDMLTFVAVLEPGGDIIFVNNTPLKIAGMNLEDIIGEKFYDTYWWEYSDEAKQTIKEDIELASSGKIISHPIQVKTTEGLIWIEFSIHPIYDDKKKVKYIVPEGRDITDSKQAEEERKVLRERLQRAEKMEALGTLAGGVAHDLNNVLGVLVGYSEILLQNVPQESPFQRHAMQIFKGSQRAAAIIQDLLTLTRRGVVVSETLNLNRVISDFLQTPEFEAIRSHHPGVQFKTSLDAELLNIKGSSTHLSKTVMNLLSNAAEAISGSGEVLIRTENRYVDRPIQGYDTTQEGEYAVLTVSDTGSGISQADLGRIFEPFYTKKVMGRSGTGLGLAVVWGTVKDHDGYIDVQSTEGEGSIFTLYFPVTREAPTEFEQAVPRDTYLGRGEHILIVDDVEGQRLLASAMLDSLGYKVSSVASGEEAIAFVKNKPVDLLILDMIMDPGMDGLDTYRSILDIRPRQKAIIVSGFSETDRVHAAQSLGAGAYIRKPYLMEKLGLAVRKELSRST